MPRRPALPRPPALQIPVPDPSHRELVERTRAGDPAAWDQLVDRFGSLVWSIAWREGMPAEDREDVFQHVFTELWMSLRRLRDPERLPMWIARATRRHCIKLARRRRRERGEPVDSFQEQLRDGGPGPEEELHSLQQRELLERGLHHLAREDRRGARLLRMLFLSDPRPAYRDIGEELGIPVGSIGPTRQRALEKLRTILEASA